MFDSLLQRLSRPNSTDEERLASLLVLTKVMAPDDTARITRLHAACGTKFIGRLLRTSM